MKWNLLLRKKNIASRVAIDRRSGGVGYAGVSYLVCGVVVVDRVRILTSVVPLYFTTVHYSIAIVLKTIRYLLKLVKFSHIYTQTHRQTDTDTHIGEK